jgi:hypothetical protein
MLAIALAFVKGANEIFFTFHSEVNRVSAHPEFAVFH